MLINDGDDDDVSINDGDDDNDVLINDGSFLLYGRVTTYFTTDV